MGILKTATLGLLGLMMLSCTGNRIWGELEPYTASAVFSVQSIYPNDQGTFSPLVPIVVRFSSALSYPSIKPNENIMLMRKGSPDTAVPFTTSLESDGRSLHLVPDSNLLRSSQYEVRVLPGIAGNSGQILTNQVSQLFSTSLGPMLVAMTPSQGTTVPGDLTSLRLEFSEPVQVNSGMIAVKDGGSSFDYLLSGGKVTLSDGGKVATIDVSGSLPWTDADFETDREIKLIINEVQAGLDGAPLDPASTSREFFIRPWWYPVANTPSLSIPASNQVFDLVSDAARLWLTIGEADLVTVYANKGDGFVHLATINVGAGNTVQALATTPFNNQLYVLVGWHEPLNAKVHVSWVPVPATASGSSLNLTKDIWDDNADDYSIVELHAETEATQVRFASSIKKKDPTIKHYTFKWDTTEFKKDKEIYGDLPVASFLHAGQASLFYAEGATSKFVTYLDSGILTPLNTTDLSTLAAAQWKSLAWAAIGYATVPARVWKYNNGSWSRMETGLPADFLTGMNPMVSLLSTPNRLFLGSVGGGGYTVSALADLTGSWQVPPRLTGKTVSRDRLAWRGNTLYAGFIADETLYVRECTP